VPIAMISRVVMAKKTIYGKNPPRGAGQRRRVFVVVFDRFQLLDATGPAQVFSTSNEEVAGRTDDGEVYVVKLVSTKAGLVTSSSGIAVACERLPRPDAVIGSLVVVAGGPGVDEAARDATLARWLVAAAPHVGRLCSVCTGAFVLGECGLLDGHKAVTHWRHLKKFADRFPGIDVQGDPIFVRSGNLYTSAGVTAGIDLCLSIVEEDHGRAHALAVAKRLVVYMKRPGGQLQFSSELLSQSSDSSEFSRLTEKIKADLPADWAVDRMADSLSTSPRTLHRQFLASYGMSPARFVTLARLERACALIEQSGSSLKAVARAVGFGSQENMNNAFVRRLGVTPADYSSRFRPQAAAQVRSKS